MIYFATWTCLKCISNIAYLTPSLCTFYFLFFPKTRRLTKNPIAKCNLFSSFTYYFPFHFACWTIHSQLKNDTLVAIIGQWQCVTLPASFCCWCFGKKSLRNICQKANRKSSRKQMHNKFEVFSVSMHTSRRIWRTTCDAHSAYRLNKWSIFCNELKRFICPDYRCTNYLP